MPGSHWLITLSPENYSITRDMRFSLLGLRSRHRKKAERVAVGDRVLYYVLNERIFPGDGHGDLGLLRGSPPVLDQPRAASDDPFPYRVHTQPNLVLEPGEGLDAEAHRAAAAVPEALGARAVVPGAAGRRAPAVGAGLHAGRARDAAVRDARSTERCRIAPRAGRRHRAN